MKSIGKLLTVFALALLGAKHAGAQVTESDKATKMEEVKSLVNSGSYTFVASKRTDTKRGGEALPVGYVLDISKDTLVAHLPGYKRANTQAAAADSSLTCTRFTYQAIPEKNGGWLVTIRPSGANVGDFGAVRELKLDISDLGHATLSISGRKPISCYGYIKQHGAEFPPASASVLRN
ncbi:MAG: hypothetical protein JWQ34_2394 [Mucilaginibacter sp.]|uniref:DUF4251 domain-containing protein n=1 Tax=Mucilaginibacter sp. TaxID=1882438 RepID=UPI0026150634|nr:DUF4251 domain-containing protein [Mucilaginibacter sp.]MDB5004169.1 hypothetical protein [Mucilaginibacter sp.]